MVLDLLRLHDYTMSQERICQALCLSVCSQEADLLLEGLLGAAGWETELG